MFNKKIPALLTTVTAIVVFMSLIVFPLEQMKIHSQIDRMRQCMAATALFMGFLNTLRVHLSEIRRKSDDWVLSVWLIAVLFIYAAFGMIKGVTHEGYSWLFNAVLAPVNASVYALSGYYMISASYRSFRIRNIEATILMTCTIWVILSNVPIGDLIWSETGWLGGFNGVRDWIVAVPNVAVSRAIGVGVFFGGFSTTLRMFLGLERRDLGGV